MLPLPNRVNPFVQQIGGRIASPWDSYLQQFTQAPPSVMAVTAGASPFSYTVKEPGCVAVSGGTVSAITFTRGNVSIDVTGQKLIPVCIQDIITVTYSVLPTIRFIPAYGQVVG